MTAQSIITFVFSDIEHSTRLAQQLREAYPEILERHRTIIRQAITRYHGREIDTAGDGFFMTFETPEAAIQAAAAIQLAFHTEDWASQIGLKVRMSIHTGVALATPNGYTGVEVHLASRICNAAFGGQTLVSDATAKALTDHLPEGISLSAMGDFRLKDFSGLTALYQLNVPGIKPRSKPRIHPDVKRVAVLPFANQSQDPDHSYIGEGVAEELIVALGKIQGLRVVSRSTAFALDTTDRDARQIGEKLRVDTVLEGRVKVNNGHIRISAELIDTDSGLNIWSGRYDSAREQLVHIQDDITRQITEALGCQLAPAQLDSIQYRQTHNAEAYDYYLRGRRFYLQFSNRGIALALQLFQKAIEADEKYALAYAGIADCYSFLYQHKAPLEDTINKADEISKKAVKLAPTLAEIHVSRGIVKALRNQLEKAEESFQYAIERDPTLFLGWFHYGRACFAAGKLDKAARLFEQANRVEPDDYQSILLSAQVYDDIGCPELARTLRQRGVDIAEKHLSLNPGDTRALYLGANALAILGQREKSLTLLQRALLLEPDDSMLLYNAGCVYALLDMKQEALSCLESAFQAGLTLRGWYENDSNLDTLRDEPRFIRLLKQLQEISA